MKGFANALAVLLLAVTPVALTSVAPALGQPRVRAVERQEHQAERQAARRAIAPPPYRAQAYRAPAYRGSAPYPGGYAQSYPAYPPAPAPGPAYSAPPAAYGYPAPPAYRAPNSLGAEWAQQQDQARAAVRQGRMLPLGQVMMRLRSNTPGRLLDAGLEPGPDGRPAYRVRWAAAGGRRIDFIVDAVTGTILSRNGY